MAASRPPTVDAHTDTMWQRTKQDILGRFADDLKASRLLCVGGQLDFPVRALYLSDAVQDEIGREKSWETVCWQADQCMGCLMGVEGARLLPDNLDDLPRGVVYVTLVHNVTNDFADSATDGPRHYGLSDKGYDLVHELQKRCILVDVSHASDDVVDDVLAHTSTFSTPPTVATHSGVRSLHTHPRNLLPHHVVQIVKKGGVVGIPAVKNFMGDTHPLDHIEEVMELTGTSEGVGIGSDLDGAMMVDGLPSAAHWWKFWGEGLAARGYSDEVIARVVGGNWIRLFKLEL